MHTSRLLRWPGTANLRTGRALATSLLAAAAVVAAAGAARAEDGTDGRGAGAVLAARSPGMLEPRLPGYVNPALPVDVGPSLRGPDLLIEPVATAGEPLHGMASELDETSYDIPGQIVVDARDDLDDASLADLVRDFSLRVMPTALTSQTRIQIATVDGPVSATLERLARDPRVEAAEPLAWVRASFVANDPLLKDQWHMARVGAERAWDFATGRGVTVAVVDTGIACEDHGPFTKGTDLASTECVEGWNFVTKTNHANDDQGHGTHVAGTIAQSTNNGLGAAGLAFHARLMPVKVLNESGWGTTADVADGIRWAAEHGAQVINLSLGGPRNSKVLQSAIDDAIAHGAVVVAAAGNTGGRVQFPGASDGVIGVSATDANDKIARFSSRGQGVDVAAPGVNVTQQTICNRGRDKCQNYYAYSGTSMAAPHVAGAAALVVSLGVTDPRAVEDALRAGARVVDDSDGGKLLYGAGILDAASSVVRVTQSHIVVRLLALLALATWVARRARKKDATATSPWRASFLIPALAAGPGLFFFAPWLLPRVDLAVDVLARPIADLDMLLGASVHRWLPLANALVPLGLTALFFGVKRLRPVIAGFAVGTAAYLTSVVLLGEVAGPLGRMALVVWCAVNAAACLWIARTNLSTR
ncbi:S8 family serine peptidase [Sorangium sp. So ce124]|uniref:S8 family serine peptidase n=1 Tax=Sorangium sp. So ce124 TaxID=3133280 RepID=UPI003F639AEB